MTRKQGRTRPDRELAQAVQGSKAPAISRAAAVLRLLGKSDVPLGVQVIARELGLVPSTCLHVLRALVAEEFVSFDSATWSLCPWRELIFSSLGKWAAAYGR
jgi:DNA-binding IclR family transcriptional regulator